RYGASCKLALQIRSLSGASGETQLSAQARELRQQPLARLWRGRRPARRLKVGIARDADAHGHAQAGRQGHQGGVATLPAPLGEILGRRDAWGGQNGSALKSAENHVVPAVVL